MALACRHVELDGVGKGKRVLRPPGGGSSNIFGSEPETNGTSPTVKNHQRSQVFNGESDGSTSPSPQVTPTRTSPRRSLDDSQNRLFGTPGSNSNSPRKLDSRNPITGRRTSEEHELNGNPHNGVSPGDGMEADQKDTPVKMHNPPGGHSQLQFY